MTRATNFLLILLLTVHGWHDSKRCDWQSSDIVKITVRNETRPEAGGDPVEEIIELEMCNGTTYLVDLKEEKNLVAENAEVAELEEDEKFHEKMSKEEIKESCRCSFEGKLQGDPDSQVSLSGCPGNEDEDGQILTLVTDKFKFRSSSYRVSNGTVSFADGELKDLVVVHKPAAAKPEETRRPKPDISGNSTKEALTEEVIKTVGEILSKEAVLPEIGGGKLVKKKKKKQKYPHVSGHSYDHLVRDSRDKWWLVNTRNRNTRNTRASEEPTGGQHKKKVVLPNIVPGKAEPQIERVYGADYKEASPALDGDDGSDLGALDYEDFKNLHTKTIKHWKEQQTKNKEKLDKIIKSKEVLVHEHSMKRRPAKGLQELYDDATIEICVITDPYLFGMIRDLFNLKTDKEVNEKIFKTVHKVLMGAETFLKHKSIREAKGGFQLKLNGIRVLKDWGHLTKMKTRKNLQDVLFDLGDYMQIINNDWDGHALSYDLAILFTGKMNFADGDGYAYIGGICQQDSPITLKMRFDNQKLNLNMGRLLAHEIGHALGANHDDDYPECRNKGHLMTSVVSNSMDTWSECTSRDVDKIVSEVVAESNCLKL